MRLHRFYERTCSACGYRWTVPRWQLKVKRIRVRLGPANLGQGNLQSPAMDEAIEAADEARDAQRDRIEQLGRCAKCGSKQFSERPVTRSHPADPSP